MLDATCLVTMHELRQYVLRDETDGDKDVLLSLLANGYSKTIIGITQRQFFAEQDTTRRYRYAGGGVLDLAPYELRSVEEIALTQAGQSSPTLLDPDFPDYYLEPREGNREGTFTWVSGLPDVGQPGAYPWKMGAGQQFELSFAGEWGTETIPPDAKMACLIACDWKFQNPASNEPEPLPQESMAYLRELVRQDVGC